MEDAVLLDSIVPMTSPPFKRLKRTVKFKSKTSCHFCDLQKKFELKRLLTMYDNQMNFELIK